MGGIASDRDRKMLQALMDGADLEALVLLPARPEWWAEAACRGRPDVNWFPTQGEPATPAKAVCASCPSREPCREFAIDEHLDVGIWGGQSARDRRRGRAGAERTARRSGLRVKRAS